jgi:hypothetical protein
VEAGGFEEGQDPLNRALRSATCFPIATQPGGISAVPSHPAPVKVLEDLVSCVRRGETRDVECERRTAFDALIDVVLIENAQKGFLVGDFAVGPTALLADATKKLIFGRDELYEGHAPAVPLERVGDPRDVRLVRWGVHEREDEVEAFSRGRGDEVLAKSAHRLPECG